MDREQMVERAAVALAFAVEKSTETEQSPDCWAEEAQAVVKELLPQVSTVAELEALPDGVVAVDVFGAPWELEDGAWRTTGIERAVEPQQILDGDGGMQLDVPRGPLTIVWQP